MGDCSPHRIIMAENQEEMSPIEMKVARQIEVILILKLRFEFGKTHFSRALQIFSSHL